MSSKKSNQQENKTGTKKLMDKEWSNEEKENERVWSAYANSATNPTQKVYDDYQKSFNKLTGMSYADAQIRKKLLDRSFEKSYLSDKERENYGSFKDAYTNPSAGYGAGTNAPQEGSGYSISRQLTRNFINLNQVYRSDAIYARILDIYAGEMSKNGIEIESNIDTDRVSVLENAVEDYKDSIEEAIKLSDHYGLSVALPIIKGQFNKSALEKPIDYSKIDKGDFQGLKVLPKWQGCMPLMKKLVTRPSKHVSASEIGEPLYYDVWFDSGGGHRKVHRSWLLIFITNDLTGIEKDIEQRSGLSLYERLDLPLKNYNSTLNYIISLLQMSTQRVLKLEGITGFEQMSKVSQENFQRKMKQIGESTRIWNVLVLGEEDEYEYKSANFSGLKELVTVSQENLSASAGLPMNKLFGKSPSGLNNSSMENFTDFYDFIEKRQKRVLKKNYQKLLQILYRDRFGEEPEEENIKFKFKSLWSLTEQDKALILERKSRVLEKSWEKDALTLSEYLQELKEIGRITDAFTNITEETFTNLKKNGISEYRYSDFVEQRVQKGAAISDKEIKNLTSNEIKDIYKMTRNKEKNQKKGIVDEIVGS